MSIVPDVALQSKLQRWSRYLTALVILIAGLVLIGWQFNIEIFKRPIPELVAMNPVTAFAFICTGISFFIITSKNFTKTKQIVASVFACLVLLIATLKITSLLFDLDLHIDRILFYGKLDRDAMGNIDSRIAVNTSLCFLFSGITLLLMVKKPRKQMLSHFLAIIIFLIAFLSLVGYLYRVQEFYGALIHRPMALNSALCFVFFSLAVLFADPGSRIMKEITSTSTGSITARSLVPVAIILPVVLGFLRLYGDWAGVFTTEFGSAILVLAIIIIFLSVIWYNAILLNRRDAMRIETENALQESENKMQTIFDAAPDAVIVIDQDSNIIKWNPKAETLFGWTANEALGNPLHEIIIPHRYREAHKKGLKHFLRTGEGPVLNNTIEIQALNKNNQEFDVALSISPTLVKDKYLFIGFVRDITEKKVAEEKIKQSGHIFSTLFYKSPVMKAIIDASTGKYIDVNDSLADFFGHTKEEMLGRTSVEIGMLVHPEEREKMIKNIQKDGFVRELEMQLNAKNGKVRWVSANVDIVNLNGKDCFLSAGIDITARKEAEEQIHQLNTELEKRIIERTAELADYKYALDESCIVAITDQKGIIKYANENFCKISKYSKEELIGQDHRIINSGYHPKEFIRDLWVTIANGKIWKGEIKNKTKDGTYYWVDTTIVPFLSEQGKPYQYVAIRADITQRKLAEEKIEGSEKKLRSLIENSNEVIIICDRHGNRLFVSEGINRMLGYTPEEFMQFNIFDTVLPEEVHSVRLILQKIIDNPHQPFTINIHIRHKNGSWRWIEAVLAGYFDVPDLNGIVITYRDVTERKKAEQEINEARDLTEKLINSLPGVFYFFDSRGKFIKWNRQLEEVTGYTSEEVAGMHPTDFFGDDEKQYISERIEGVFLKGINDAEASFLIKTGERIPYYFKAVLINYEGEPCLLGNGIDITERKKFEEKQALFVSIVNSSDDAILSKTLDGIITSWNRGAEKVFGYSAKEIIGKHISILIPPHLQNEENEIMKKIRMGEGVDHYETERIKKNGKVINVSLTISPIKDSLGNIIGASKISRDITERKKVEEELRTSELKYKLLFESNPLPMWMMSLPDYDIIEANDSALLQYGYIKDEFLQLNIFDLRPAEDIEKFKASMDLRFRGIYHGGIWRHRKKDGTIIYVDIVTHDLYYEGKPVRLVLANDVTEKYITQEKLKESYDSIRKLTDHLQNIREEERTHIAREIHDELGQQLTILKMDISWLNKKIDTGNEPVKEKINELLSVVDATVKTVRRIASELRPSLLDDLGLVSAMEWHLEEFEKRSGIHKHFTAPETNMQLPDEMKIGLFRIFQESLTNVARHSKAKEVNVELKQGKKEVILTIADDGEGYNEKNAGKRTLGILGMKERTLMLGGHYNISGTPGKGTTVSVVVPIHDRDQ